MLSHTDRGTFKTITDTAARDYLLDKLIDGKLDTQQGVAQGTLQQQAGGFVKWMQFCTQCGIQDHFLTNFDVSERISMLSAFAGAIRRNEFGTRNKSRLAGSTVQATLGNVCSSFRTNLRPYPSLDESGNRAMILTRQIQGYVADDPALKHECCLPLSVYNA